MRWSGFVALIALASPVLAADNKDLLNKADAALKAKKFAEAAALASQAIEADPGSAGAFDLRGTANFKMGNIKESLADFDKQIELNPIAGPAHWRRGLTLYYAEKFADGVAQFTTSDKEEPNDVENAIWHFLCNARVKGLEKARGETAALRNLANAASLLENNPNLMQLRLLQSLEKNSGNTVVLLPADGNGAARLADRLTPGKK